MAGWRDQNPPLSRAARREAGFLLRQLQEGEKLSLPHSRPMTSIGKGCHELRINDKTKTWRLFYYMDSGAIVILDVNEKKTQKTPQIVVELCRKRLKSYEQAKK
jgi:phage-related protein